MTAAPLAILLPTFNGGGAERAMVMLARGMVERGIQVDLLVCNATGPLSEIIDPRLRVFDLKSQRVRGAFLPLVRYLKARAPQALIATIQHTNLLAIAAVRASRVNTRVVVRQSTSHLSERGRSFIHRSLLTLIPWIYPLADRVVAVSEGVREQLRQVNSRLDICVLPNPVLGSDFDERANEQIDHPWFSDPDQPVVVAAGRLQHFKGFETLMRAFAAMPGNERCKLLVLGEGPERAQLERTIQELGISDRCDLPGFVINPLPYMRRADLFVLSSSCEGMPNVLLQAMACGTPVVSTDCPSGPREILEGGALGQLVPVGDVHALSAAMRAALDTEVHPDTSGKIRKAYSVQRAVEDYLAIAGVSASNFP